MASNPPGKCCGISFKHEGASVGSFKELYGLKSYVTGTKSDKLLVIAPDIYGYDYVNLTLIADRFGKAGYHVIVPDYFGGDAYTPEKGELPTWLAKHMPDKTAPLFDSYVKAAVADLKPKKVYGIGYCYGAKLIVQHLSKSGLVDVGAVAHPSFVTEEEVDSITKPLLISAAQTDSSFTPELRHKTEEILIKNNQDFEITLFGKVVHGFAVRGDLTKKEVLHAAQKTFSDQLCWFDLHA